MKTPRSTKTRAKEAKGTKLPAEIPERWRWFYEKLSELRDRLDAERGHRLREGAEPIQRYSMHQADSATDEFDHELALSQLSAEQDELYEIEAAMRRIAEGTYGVCEQTGKRIPIARLKAVPWTRFSKEAEARLETSGAISRPRLGPLGSVRKEPAAALAEAEPTVEQREPAAHFVKSAEPPEER
jgi:RNA polymerase-binding transcription factor DksA